MLVRHRLLRFLRLVATLATLFIAQPSTAAVNVVDRIVLVANTSAVEVAPESEEASARVSRVPAVQPGGEESGAADGLLSLAPLQSPRALRERTYLLHCALLR